MSAVLRHGILALLALLLPVSGPLFSVHATPMERQAAAAPEVTFRTLDGVELTPADLRGKVVVVDFWATWCAPCVEEIPGYVALQRRHGDAGLVIIGVSLDRRSADHVRQFATRHGINYPIVLADAAEIAEAFGGIEALPTTILIDREGRIRHRKVGAMSAADYARIVESVLN